MIKILVKEGTPKRDTKRAPKGPPNVDLVAGREISRDGFGVAPGPSLTIP